MEKIKTICLISTFHDPEGDRALKFLKKHLKKIKNLFGFIKLAITDKTSEEIIQFLEKNKVDYKITSFGFGTLSRRIVLKNGLKTNATHFFHIDLDRLLFWLEKYPRELTNTLKKIKDLKENEYLTLGRTQKAWQAYPSWQEKPEKRTNQAISKEINQKVDVTTGCYASGRSLAKIISQKPKGKTPGVSDIEWLMIAKLFGKAQIKSIKTNGLTYETKLIFGKKRAQKPKGNYPFSREKLADKTIKMIEKTLSRREQL